MRAVITRQCDSSVKTYYLRSLSEQFPLASCSVLGISNTFKYFWKYSQNFQQFWKVFGQLGCQVSGNVWSIFVDIRKCSRKTANYLRLSSEDLEWTSTTFEIPRMTVGSEGGWGTWQSLTRGGSAPRSNPLPIPFCQKRYPFYIPTLEHCSPFLSHNNEVNEQYYGRISSIIIQLHFAEYK